MTTNKKPVTSKYPPHFAQFAFELFGNGIANCPIHLHSSILRIRRDVARALDQDPTQDLVALVAQGLPRGALDLPYERLMDTVVAWPAGATWPPLPGVTARSQGVRK